MNFVFKLNKKVSTSYPRTPRTEKTIYYIEK